MLEGRFKDTLSDKKENISAENYILILLTLSLVYYRRYAAEHVNNKDLIEGDSQRRYSTGIK